MADTKRHPDTTYGAKYPYLKSFTTESGHSTEHDDTPGNERIRTAHKSGSYDEISADGRRVTATVNNQVIYTKGGLTISVDQNGDIKIGGHARITVGGDAHIEVSGDVSAAVGGNMTTSVTGSSIAHVGGTAFVTANNMSMQVDNNLNIKAKNIGITAVSNFIINSGRWVSVVQGKSSTEVVGKVSEVYHDSYLTYVKGDRSLTTDSTYTIQSKSSMTLNSSDTFNANSMLGMVLKGKTIDLNP